MMLARSVLGLLLVVSAASSVAGAPLSRQQMFDAAQAAYDKEDWAAAATGFQPLLKDEAHPSRTDGIIRARYAMSLFMAGRADEAEPQAVRATKEFPVAGVDEERALAFVTVARIETAALDMRAAMEAYGKARAALPADAAYQFQIDLAEAGTAMVEDPARALALMTAVVGSPRFATLDKNKQAQIVAVQARAQLNSGDAKGAVPVIRRAIALSGGGETTRINVIQASIRGDAALILLRAGQVDEARRTLAYSGGGYMPNSGWLGTAAGPPVCDEMIHPDDVAVVEFNVSDTGDVTTALPVYASRPGTMGVLFAQQARQWHFEPESFKGVNAFWRSGLRLELRCVSRPASQSLYQSFFDATREWLDANGMHVADHASLSDGTRSRPLSPAMERLFGLMTQAKGPNRRARATNDEVTAALVAAHAPPDVLALFAFNQIGNGTDRLLSAPRRSREIAEAAGRFRAMPDGGRAAAWFDVETAIERETTGDFAGARPFLEHAIATPRETLDEHDPVRLVAVLHLSLVERQLGAATAADERLRTAGLDAERCSLFDVRPVPVREGASSDDFPREALDWHMEGFTRSAFDIGADGKVANVRTVAAYPPFVFSEGTEKIVRRFRYLPPTLNKVALGCSANARMFRFQVAH